MSWFPRNLCALLAIYEDNQGISQGNNRWNFQTLKFYHPNDLICTRIRDSKHLRIPNPSSKKKRKQQSFPKTSQDMGVRHYVIMYWFVSKKAGIPRFIALSFTNVFWAAPISTEPRETLGTLCRPRAWSAHGRFVRTTFWWLQKALQRKNFYHDVCVCVCFFNWVKTWNHQRIDSQAFTNGWPSGSRIIYIRI